MSIKTGKTGSIYSPNVITAFTTEATTEDGTTKIYQIDATTKRIWDINTTVELNVGDLDTSYCDGGINYFEGKVKLLTTGETTLVITGASMTIAKVAAAFGWGLDMTIETGETTEIGETSKTFIPLGKTASVTISRYRTDTDFDDLGNSDYYLLKLMEDDTEGYWCNALKTSISLTKSIGAIDNESLSFTVNSNVVRI